MPVTLKAHKYESSSTYRFHRQKHSPYHIIAIFYLSVARGSLTTNHFIPDFVHRALIIVVHTCKHCPWLIEVPALWGQDNRALV